MSEQLLQVKNLVVNVEDTEILHGIDLEINRGETHVLMGPNGAGKSTLGYALMGSPRYQLTNGQIWFKGQDITEESTDKRAKAGLFLSFQNPLEVPGITLGNFLRNALEQRTGQRIRPWEFRKELKKAMDVLQMDHSYADHRIYSVVFIFVKVIPKFALFGFLLIFFKRRFNLHNSKIVIIIMIF